MDASMWDHFPETPAPASSQGLSTEAAKPKGNRAPEVPTQQRMKADIRPAQQRKPSADQKRVRRQMARQADMLDATPSSGERLLYCPACGGPLSGSYDGVACTKCSARYTPTVDAGQALGLGPDEVFRIEEGTGLLHAVKFASTQTTIHASTTTKESTMSQHQPTEADLIQRLARATTLVEQAAISSQLESLRTAARESAAQRDVLDWDGMGVLPPSAEQRMAHALLSDATALPPLTASTRLGHTDATDWLMDMTPTSTPDAVLSTTARAEATRWFEDVYSPVKQDAQEFSVQAYNAGARTASRFGMQATAAHSVFMDQIRHLASREGITLIALDAPKGTCAICGQPMEQESDGSWSHMPGHPDDHEAKTATRRHAMDETVDTYVSDGKTTQPVGVDPKSATDSMDEWGIGSDLNDGADPKSTTDRGDAPSLSEGSQPEQGSSESLDNPNFGQTDVDKSEWAVGNTDDKMSTQGSRKQAVHLTNVGIEGEYGVGTDPSGNRVKFTLTESDRESLKSVLYSDLAMNFSGVDVTEDEIVKDASLVEQRVQAHMASTFGNTMGAGIRSLAQEEQSTSADGMGSADAATPNAPSMQEGDTPETGHSESPVQNNGEGAKDMSSATPHDNLRDVNWGSTAARQPRHSLATIAASFAGKPVSPVTATLAQGLAAVGSIHGAVGSVSARQIVSSLMASHEVPASVKQALSEHLAAEEGGNTCSVCGDKIAQDPNGESPSTWHHDNGEKHDHEAKPSGSQGGESKEGQRAPFAREAAAPLTVCQRKDCGAAITEWKGVNDRYGHGTAYICANGHTNYVSDGNTPYGGTSMASKQAAEDNNLPAKSEGVATPEVDNGPGSANQCRNCHLPIVQSDGEWHHMDPTNGEVEAKACAQVGKSARKTAGDVPDALKAQWDKGGDAKSDDDSDDDKDSGKPWEKDGTTATFRRRVQAGLKRVADNSSLKEGDRVDIAKGAPRAGGQSGVVATTPKDTLATVFVKLDSGEMVGVGRDNVSLSTTSAKQAFNLSDAKNDEGEWIMSPEEIRAEMNAGMDDGDYDDWFEREASKRTAGKVRILSRPDGMAGTWSVRVQSIEADEAQAKIREWEARDSRSGRMYKYKTEPVSDDAQS